jgi:DNA-directed RNA polymerase subunit M/transcription elongation factor TFIIS
MRFCPVCSYYLFLTREKAEETEVLQLLCRHCGYKELMNPKTSEEALILETTFNTSASHKQTASLLNEYTKLDPTLPHLKTIPCPNASCPTQGDPASRDILYIKTDAKNLKYQYNCTVCNTQWGS